MNACDALPCDVNKAGAVEQYLAAGVCAKRGFNYSVLHWRDISYCTHTRARVHARCAPVIPVVSTAAVQVVVPDRLAPENTASAPVRLPEGLPPPPWWGREATARGPASHLQLLALREIPSPAIAAGRPASLTPPLLP